MEANKNGQNDRIIAVEFQSAYQKVKCLNKTYNSTSMMVFEEICADGKTQLVFVNEQGGASAPCAKASQQWCEADFPGFLNGRFRVRIGFRSVGIFNPANRHKE
uniref:Uncharacterized protein n=1 Tax=Caenorhabditis japonica TaxID=281687 RepID=A0A8R1EDT8_CAEJA